MCLLSILNFVVTIVRVWGNIIVIADLILITQNVIPKNWVPSDSLSVCVWVSEQINAISVFVLFLRKIQSQMYHLIFHRSAVGLNHIHQIQQGTCFVYLCPLLTFMEGTMVWILQDSKSRHLKHRRKFLHEKRKDIGMIFFNNL